MAEELRKLAQIIRTEAASVEQAKTEKSAQMINAAVGLTHLKNKLGVR